MRVVRSEKSLHSCTDRSSCFLTWARKREAERTMARTLWPLDSAWGIRCLQVREVPFSTAIVCVGIVMDYTENESTSEVQSRTII